MNCDQEKAPIRVLQVTGIMNRGGAETMIMNLYRHIDRDKVQFDFVENSLEPGAFDEEIQSFGGKIYRCPHFNGKNFFAYRQWWERFWNQHATEYPVVHGHIGSTAAIYLSAAKKRGVLTIAHSHGANSKDWVRSSMYRVLSYRTRLIADFFFACSEQAGIDRFGKRIIKDTGHYRILKNAIDTEAFSFDQAKRKQKRDSLLLLDNEFLIGHVGRFTGEKNHAFLLDIFSEIRKNNPSAELVFIGDGPLRMEIQKKAENLQISESVRFLGVRDDVSELMQAMDLLLFPSKNEGLPLTLVEAQTAGLPCVISDAIPGDCILCEDLVTTASLSDSPGHWAELVCSKTGGQRRNHAKAVADAGFDIRETAKWLEEFYLERAKRRYYPDGFHANL